MERTQVEVVVADQSRLIHKFLSLLIHIPHQLSIILRMMYLSKLKHQKKLGFFFLYYKTFYSLSAVRFVCSLRKTVSFSNSENKLLLEIIVLAVWNSSTSTFWTVSKSSKNKYSRSKAAYFSRSKCHDFSKGKENGIGNTPEGAEYEETAVADQIGEKKCCPGEDKCPVVGRWVNEENQWAGMNCCMAAHLTMGIPCCSISG